MYSHSILSLNSCSGNGERTSALTIIIPVMFSVKLVGDVGQEHLPSSTNRRLSVRYLVCTMYPIRCFSSVIYFDT